MPRHGSAMRAVTTNASAATRSAKAYPSAVSWEWAVARPARTVSPSGGPTSIAVLNAPPARPARCGGKPGTAQAGAGGEGRPRAERKDDQAGPGETEAAEQDEPDGTDRQPGGQDAAGAEPG